MVQLSDDSAHGEMLDLDSAVQRLASLASGLTSKGESTKSVPLSSAVGLVMVQDLVARIAVPKRDNSAVDGVAYRDADVPKASEMAELSLMAKTVIATNQPQSLEIPPGHAVKIMTGAALPNGADTICMNEDLQFAYDSVKVPSALKIGSNLRPAGEDFQPGDLIIDAGNVLTARHLAAAIAAGYASDTLVPVSQRALKVLVKPTGDELGQGDDVLVNDCNSPMLAQVFEAWGFDTECDTAPLSDELEKVTQFFFNASDTAAIIITTGGVSTGDKDYLKEGFEAAGGTVDFWRIGIKPGRPVAVGTIGSTLWIGLPGNPVAALVTALAVALPTLRALAGENVKPLPGYWVKLVDPYKKKAGRREFVRVQVTQSTSPVGLPIAKKFHKAGAGMVSGLIWADGLAQIPDDLTRVEPGTAVWFTPWESYRL